jgi:hypothetical protein
MWSKSVANAIKHTLPLLKHQVCGLACASGASVCCRTLGKAATDGKPPQPITKILLCDAKNRLKDGDAHQRCRERDSLKRNREELVIVEWHYIDVARSSLREGLNRKVQLHQIMTSSGSAFAPLR